MSEGSSATLAHASGSDELIIARPESVIIHGTTSSYYIKQLALQAALDVTRGANAPHVELDIDVL